MNPSRDPLEQELERLRPAPLPPALRERLLAARTRAPIPMPRRWIGPLALAAAAALVLAGFLRESSPPPATGDALPLPTPQSTATLGPDPGQATEPASVPPEARLYAPVAYSNTLLAAEDDGVVASEQGEPVRRLRYLAEDSYRFRDASTGATVEVRVPREGILLVGLDPI